MVPFNISEESVSQLKRLLARAPQTRPEHCIRIYISGLSAGGPEWSLTLDTYSPEADECCEFDELRVIIERDLLEDVGGIDVKYEDCEDDGEAGGFLITALDPQIQELYNAGCGCCSGGCGSCHGHDCDGDCDCCDCGGSCGSRSYECSTYPND